ncbi:MAG: hypothetical protein KDC52_12830, partial [Ignavibacteriae bacterium]|nr:hypothetical protein [Ignavibacteriota bacterium]
VLLILFTSGFLAGFVQVHIQTILQITTESNMRGRIFGFIGTISGALIPIGMGVAGFVADLTNKNIPVIYIGSGIFILLISLYIVGSKDIRDFLAIDYSPRDGSKNNKTNDIVEKVSTKNQNLGQIYNSNNNIVTRSVISLNLAVMEKIKNKLKQKK